MSRQIAAPVTAKDAQCRWARRMCRSLRHASQTSGALRTHILLVSLLMLGAPLYAASSGNTITPTGVITTLTTPAAHAACGGVPVPPGLQPPTTPTPVPCPGAAPAAAGTSGRTVPGCTTGKCESKDRIDYGTLQTNENDALPISRSGYVPGYDKTGKAIGESGVTIGYGVDLGHQGLKELKEWGLDDALIKTLTPYLGKTKTSAILYLYGDGTKKNPPHPLTVTADQADAMSTGARTYILGKMTKAFDSDNTIGIDFYQLPEGTQTAVADFFYQHGPNSNIAYKKLWNAITTGKWATAATLMAEESGKPHTRLVSDAKKIGDDVKAQRYTADGVPKC